MVTEIKSPESLGVKRPFLFKLLQDPEGPWPVSVTHMTDQMLLLQGTCSWAPPRMNPGPLYALALIPVTSPVSCLTHVYSFASVIRCPTSLPLRAGLTVHC